MKQRVDGRRWLVGLGWANLVRRVWGIGYHIRMISTLQTLDPWFSVEGGGPHPNPVVSDHADFRDFPFCPDGIEQALKWVEVREREQKTSKG